ncbi:hypothetical protein [Kurthia sibirica]|uniref:Uncharacterized protein n=1 Tax=Kurthia sibirica TaxID=202750 RepID=A0A2U3AFR7_9BACL|nr:hypothetical protein [Kurthia sibirica]PWI23367.1 hypothetical protein DEX24_16175 [Kurthia sibirica]GEK35631.1 hypothetical protein KSI01_31640 [Kurthia sibirica]
MGKRGESEKIRKSFLIDSTDERIINFIASQKNLSETIRHLILDAESRIGNQDYFEYVTKEFRELKKEMQRLEQLKEAAPTYEVIQNDEVSVIRTESTDEQVTEPTDELNDEHDAEPIADTPVTKETVDTTPDVPMKKDVSPADLRKARKRK